MAEGKRRVVEVQPAKGADLGWNVKIRGAGSGTRFETKDPAIDRAKQIAKAAPLGQVVIKKQDGTIQTEHTYGKDRRRSKG